MTTTSTEATNDTQATGETGETIPSYTGSFSELKFGDVDLSGGINVGDVTKLAKYFINKETYRLGDKEGSQASIAKALTQADVEYNGTVDKVDLSKLIEYCLGSISEYALGPKDELNS